MGKERPSGFSLWVGIWRSPEPIFLKGCQWRDLREFDGHFGDVLVASGIESLDGSVGCLEGQLWASSAVGGDRLPQTGHSLALDRLGIVAVGMDLLLWRPFIPAHSQVLLTSNLHGRKDLDADQVWQEFHFLRTELVQKFDW